MPISLIDKIKPKNNGTFPLVDAIDIEHNGKRLPEYIEQKIENAVPEGNMYEANTMYFLSELSEDLTLGFPDGENGDMVLICFSSGNSVVAVTTSTDNHVGLENLIIMADRTYELIGLYRDNKWSFAVNEQAR